MIRSRLGLRSIAGLLVGLMGAAGPMKADVPQLDAPAYQALRKIGKKKPNNGTGRKRWGRMLRYPMWCIKGTKKMLPFHKTPFRPYCSIHEKRFKHLRYRARLWDEGTGLVRSIKAKAFGCPTCIRATPA